MDVADLLAPGSGLRARGLAIAPGVVAIVTEATSSVAECPGCGAPSEHVHGRYTRTVAAPPGKAGGSCSASPCAGSSAASRRAPGGPSPSGSRPSRPRRRRQPGWPRHTGRSASRRAVSPGHGSPIAWPCPPARTCCCAASGRPTLDRPRRRESWASTTSRSAGAGPMARSWSTSNATASSTCFRTERRPRWRPGCGRTSASSSSRGIGLGLCPGGQRSRARRDASGRSLAPAQEHARRPRARPPAAVESDPRTPGAGERGRRGRSAGRGYFGALERFPRLGGPGPTTGALRRGQADARRWACTAGPSSATSGPTPARTGTPADAGRAPWTRSRPTSDGGSRRDAGSAARSAASSRAWAITAG